MTLVARTGVVFLSLLLCHDGIADDSGWQGAPLRNYIEALQQQGLRVLYSSDLILAEYRVKTEPDTADPRAALLAALRPYGLTLAQAPGSNLLITRDANALHELSLRIRDASDGSAIAGAEILIDGIAAGATDGDGRVLLRASGAGPHTLDVQHEDYVDVVDLTVNANGGELTAVAVQLQPFDETLSEIVVTSSLYNLRYEAPEAHTFLTRDLTSKLPDIGDEAVRALSRLPGTANGGVSTRNHVRGGVQNEQLFLLDGLRLYEPYHLKDFQSLATVVDQSVIAGIDFYSAAYPARYGDRMSGVVDISLREPMPEIYTELGLSLFNVSALSMGRFGGHGRGDWMVSLRRGNLDVVADIVNSDFGSPRYEDTLLHVGWRLTPDTILSANLLYAYDKISIAANNDNERASARYRNAILWLKAETDWSDTLSSSTILSTTDIDTARAGESDVPDVLFGNVDDNRNFQSLALKQDWRLQASDSWSFSSGFDLKHLDASYRYASSLTLLAPFAQIFDNVPLTERTIVATPAGSQFAAYAEARWRLHSRLVIDAGLRWDQQTYTTAADDEQFSPRLNVLYRLGEHTDLRLGFGRFYQAQEINELQVSDGVAEFFSAQRANHYVASLSHQLSDAIDLRLEWYQKEYHTLMPRFENAFDALVLIPELQFDRVRIDADTAVSRGAELLVNGKHRNLQWWGSYTWSESADRIAGRRVPRSWDQAHTLKAGLNVDWQRFSVSAAGTVHSGWPTTALITDAAAGGASGLSVTTTPRNNLRHAVFNTLDVRISRRFAIRHGELSGFLEISNLYNRSNPCCTGYRPQQDANGNTSLEAHGGDWLPIVPSLGVIWAF